MIRQSGSGLLKYKRLGYGVFDMMASSSRKPPEFANRALIQDETLLSICLVLENGWPAGPCFLHALNTLVEAIVLHDKVYFDALHQFRREDVGRGNLPALLQQSSFVRLLLDENVICELPSDEDLDALFASQGREYSYGHFLSDAYWGKASFASASPESEESRLQLYLELVNTSLELLKPQRLVASPADGSDQVGVREHVREYILTLADRQIGLNDGDLLILEALNYRAKAFVDLARHAGLHMQPFYLALPHQLGAIHFHNSIAMRLWKDLQERFQTLEFEDEDERSFTRHPIPLLSEVLLARCKDSMDAIGLELLNLRQDHSAFRSYLTEFDQRWNTSTSKRQRSRMRAEFDAAIEKLLKHETRSSTRVIYTLWDLIKEPTKILKAGGDKLAERGREEYIINRVRGLHDFWADLANSPPASVTQGYLRRLFPNRLNEST